MSGSALTKKSSALFNLHRYARRIELHTSHNLTQGGSAPTRPAERLACRHSQKCGVPTLLPSALPQCEIGEVSRKGKVLPGDDRCDGQKARPDKGKEGATLIEGRS
jgi:hypothetical protein